LVVDHKKEVAVKLHHVSVTRVNGIFVGSVHEMTPSGERIIRPYVDRPGPFVPAKHDARPRPDPFIARPPTAAG
jgi:hypothetical protein